MVATTYDIPALLAKAPAPETSDRYRFISTQHLVDRLHNRGWDARQAFYRKSRVTSPLYAKHCIRFSNNDYTNLSQNDSFPEIVLYNSHDGKSAAQMILGIFRMVCSNGMTILDEEYERFNIPHRGYKAGDKYINHAIDNMNLQSNRATITTKNWQHLELSRDNTKNFYQDAIKLRFPEAENGEEWIFDIAQRSDDNGTNLWTVFNRCQEYLERCGFSVTHTAGKKPRMSRELTNIETTKKLNEDLWGLGTKYYAHLN